MEIAIGKTGVSKMTILEYYPEISDRYPEYITQKQMYEICGVCQSTVYKAEQSGIVPYEKAVNHLLHTHKISLTDALTFKYRREYGYRQDEEYLSYLRRFYNKQLKSYPDVLYVMDIVEITGFVKNSVQRWIARSYIKAFIKCRRSHIPKQSLIDFLISPVYNAIQDKSETQMTTLREFGKWYSARMGGVKI